jgi:hypothetical protein
MVCVFISMRMADAAPICGPSGQFSMLFDSIGRDILSKRASSYSFAAKLVLENKRETIRARQIPLINLFINCFVLSEIRVMLLFYTIYMIKSRKKSRNL